MIKIAIVDDDIQFGANVEAIARKFFDKSGMEYMIKRYMLPGEVVFDIEDSRDSDIYCLDIMMPGIDGLKLASHIRQRCANAYIIFMTSHDEFMEKGYEYNAWRYIIKGKEEEKLPRAFETILEDISRTKVMKYYIIENGAAVARLLVSDIYYLRIEKKYTVLCTSTTEFRVRKPLAQVVSELNSDYFYYIDKSTVINLQNAIWHNNSVRFLNGLVLSVSVTQKKRVREAMLAYWRMLE